MSEEQFADLEKIKLEILKEKAETGISEFKGDVCRQWTELRFEKPLLEKLLSLIEQAEKYQEIKDTWINIEENGIIDEVEDFYNIVHDILGGRVVE